MIGFFISAPFELVVAITFLYKYAQTVSPSLAQPLSLRFRAALTSLQAARMVGFGWTECNCSCCSIQPHDFKARDQGSRALSRQRWVWPVFADWGFLLSRRSPRGCVKPRTQGTSLYLLACIKFIRILTASRLNPRMTSVTEIIESCRTIKYFAWGTQLLL